MTPHDAPPSEASLLARLAAERSAAGGWTRRARRRTVMPGPTRACETGGARACRPAALTRLARVLMSVGLSSAAVAADALDVDAPGEIRCPASLSTVQPPAAGRHLGVHAGVEHRPRAGGQAAGAPLPLSGERPALAQLPNPLPVTLSVTARPLPSSSIQASQASAAMRPVTR